MNEEVENDVKPTPTPAPTPTPSPIPTSTPTPSPISSQEDDMPSPAPTDVYEPEPMTTQTRFFQRDNGDGTITIYDRENHYNIIYSKENGYVAYNEAGNEVYHIYPDKTTSIKLEDGYNIVTNDIDSIDQVTGYVTVTDGNGIRYTVHDSQIIEKKITYDDGSFDRYYYKSDNSFRVYKSNGDVIYYDSEGKEYKHEYYENSVTSYKTETGDNFVVYPSGTYTLYGDKVEYGTYRIDADGNFICYDDLNNIAKRDPLGKLLEYNSTNGSHISIDYHNKAQVKTRNGNTTYSMINHIKYDEEDYNTILDTFASINETYSDELPKKKSSINDIISKLPDTYSSGTIDGICDSIITNIKFVNSIKEMTNYSLLAYQTCDEELKTQLELLVDSLFEDNESNLADNFKKAISYNVEDRDNDTILEYKSDTNFNLLYDNVIPAFSYTDEDGNIWYFNKRNLLVGTEGENFKINYGGENFTMNYNQDGIMIITDSNGNPLNIFADYNTESIQFGSNQESFYGTEGTLLLDDPNVQALLEKYYPEATDEQKIAYLNAIANTGCANAGITNLVFKKFEGHEQDFYKTFGYQMYNIKFDEGNLSVDYNYEPVLLDLFSNGHKKNNIEEATKSAIGTSVFGRNDMESYLRNKYGVTLDNLPEKYTYLGESGYSLYEMDGTLYYENGGGHCMIIVGYADNGDPIVSSWGRKYILKRSGSIFDSFGGIAHKKDYN